MTASYAIANTHVDNSQDDVHRMIYAVPYVSIFGSRLRRFRYGKRSDRDELPSMRRTGMEMGPLRSARKSRPTPLRRLKCLK